VVISIRARECMLRSGGGGGGWRRRRREEEEEEETNSFFYEHNTSFCLGHSLFAGKGGHHHCQKEIPFIGWR
jgi:hypothetical protein